ncbi:hypothetical protein CEXT_314531 [Caerostris extrusa]|uniref:Secreted protein n=1 Tax=Caerostris extrusa TaxID=172846 RepID=A0AAV4WYY9_CAEEX|nr:hypothetical protein CEXT_314531 [Caerostris extrusa]
MMGLLRARGNRCTKLPALGAATVERTALISLSAFRRKWKNVWAAAAAEKRNMHSLTRICSSTAFFFFLFRSSIPRNNTHNPGQMHNDPGRKWIFVRDAFLPKNMQAGGKFSMCTRGTARGNAVPRTINCFFHEFLFSETRQQCACMQTSKEDS